MIGCLHLHFGTLANVVVQMLVHLALFVLPVGTNLFWSQLACVELASHCQINLTIKFFR
jgi:hypothetical protein